MRLLVTGAGGFVGSSFCSVAAREHYVRQAVRRPVPGTDLDAVVVGEIGRDTDWRPVLEGIDVVLHLAARAHVMRESAADPDAAYHSVNVEGTLALASAAARAGVRRLIFLGSVKVNGERTTGRPLREDDPPAPADAYARSKWQGELGLREIAGRTGLEVVIIRAPLVYGPGVKGNILRLLGWLRRGLPLPLASVRNRRSLIGVDNLCDLLLRAIEHPAAAGGTFFAADEFDVSTPDLLRAMGHALGRPARLMPVPPALLRAGGRLTGRSDQVGRLLDSLQVDRSRARDVLGWRPRQSLVEGLRRTAEWFLSR